jgi:hypothetical protein
MACAAYRSALPRNTADFIEPAENFIFPDLKLIGALYENVDGHLGGNMAQPVLVDVLLTDFNQ